MKNWQKNRNYKRIKDENGNVIANIITIDGIDVEVTEEVFLAYSQILSFRIFSILHNDDKKSRRIQ